MKNLLFLCVCLALLSAASANQAREALKNYLISKTAGGNPHPGMVCESLGTDPKKENCFNKNGNSQCYVEKWIDQFYDPSKGSVDDWWNFQGGKCDKEAKKIWNEKGDQAPGKVCYEWRKARYSKTACPSPCNCWLKRSPKVSGDQLLRHATFSNPTFEQIREVLRSWNVPEVLDAQFEQATMFGSADFFNFHFFVQQDKRKTNYEINVGNARNVDGNVELAFLQSRADAKLSTKVAVDVGGDTKSTHWRTVVDSKLSLPELEQVRQTLEFFALDSIDFGPSVSTATA